MAFEFAFFTIIFAIGVNCNPGRNDRDRVVFVKYECVRESCERCLGSGCTAAEQFGSLADCQAVCKPPRCVDGRVWLAEELESFRGLGLFRSCSKQGSLFCRQACEQAYSGQNALGTCHDGSPDTCTCEFCSEPKQTDKCDKDDIHYVPVSHNLQHSCVNYLKEAIDDCAYKCWKKFGSKLVSAECDQFGCHCGICDIGTKRYFCTTSNRCDQCKFMEDCPMYARLYETRSQCGKFCSRPPKAFQCINSSCVSCFNLNHSDGKTQGIVCMNDRKVFTDEEDCIENCGQKCNENEEHKACGSSCQPSCSDPFPDNCVTRCMPGCHCKDGFIRQDQTMKCVKSAVCPNEVCSQEKQYSSCGSACPATCDDPDPVCDAQCTAGCFCPHGKILDSSGKCVDFAECPVCGKNEVYLSCGPSCRATCAEPIPPVCADRCTSGCFCKPGFILDITRVALTHTSGRCVFQDQCKDPVCEDGKLFNECGCFPSCQRPFCRSKHCKPGCECAGEQLLSANGVCLDPADPEC